jgi:hypothetical protein
MAMGSLARSIVEIGKNEAKSDLLSAYGPPSRDDFLHDAFVRAGGMLGGLLGGGVGGMAGTAMGSPLAGAAAGVALMPPAALAGAWAAHGTYLQGLLAKDIVTHPENWTVDAAGALVPVTQPPTNGDSSTGARTLSGFPKTSTIGSSAPPIDGPAANDVFVRDSAAAAGVPSRRNVFEYGFPEVNSARPSVFDTGTSPVPSTPQNGAGGLPGMIASQAGIDPSNPNAAPPAGGLLGLIQEYMRNDPDGAPRR